METYVWATLIIGFIAGFLGQRSRMCFVGGIRDLYLIKSTYLFKGLIAFVLAAVIGYFIFNNGVAFPWFIGNDIMTAIPGAPCSGLCGTLRRPGLSPGKEPRNRMPP